MKQLPAFLVNPDPELYRSSNYLVLDFETTNLEKGSALNPDNRIVLACWKTPSGLFYKFGGELEQQELVAACNAADFIVAHNAKFELQWLARCGYDIGSRPVFCTYAAEWVLGGNLYRYAALSLDQCLARRGHRQKDSLVSKLIKDGLCPSEIPRSWLLRYCANDVRLDDWLFHRQLSETDGTRLLPVIFTRCLTIPPLADIETNGLHLDRARVEKEYNETLAEYNAVMEELDALTGGINPRSPQQVAAFVYGTLGFKEKTDRKGAPIRNKPSKQFPDGVPKCDEQTLLSLGASTPDQKRFLDLKKRQGQLSAALDKNLALFYGACLERDCFIYAQLNQGNTKTHRLSSSGRSTYFKVFDDTKGCQFQNLPRIYKPLFSPRHEGWLFGEADGSQLEFRVGGHCGDCDVIRREVREGYDVHRFTASVMFEVEEDDVDKEQRTDAKPDTFKPFYGGTKGTPEQEAYYKAFAEKYHELVEVQEDWCIEVGATKKLVTEWGLVFHYPEAKYNRYGYLNVRTKVFNIPIQNLATGEIIPIGLVYFWHRTRDAQMLLVNTVHDSIEAEFPPEERELFEEVAVQSLTHDVYKYLDEVYNVQFSVPLGVGITIGTHWGEPLPGEEEININVETPHV